MTAYRAPDFNERILLSRQARQKALDRLKARPAPSGAELAERKAAAIKREEAQATQRAARVAEKHAAAEVANSATEAAVRAAGASAPPVRSDADRKADRDARYAARKSRKAGR